MKTQNQILEILRNNKPLLFSKYPVKQLAIFGSFSRNDQNENSYLDVLVEFNSKIGMGFIELADELEDILLMKIDLVSKNGIKEKYYNAIKDELKYV